MKELKILGERMRALRIDQGMKMSDLSARAAVSKDTLSSLEHGRSITTESLVRILNALGQGNAISNLVEEPLPSPYLARKLKGQTRKRVR